MNVETGELVRIAQGEDVPGGATPIPSALQAEAEALIAAAGARGETPIVPIDGDGELSQFRRDQLRQRAKERAKRRKKEKKARQQRKLR